MNPDRSRKALLEYAVLLANRVDAGEINSSAVFALLGSMALRYCIPDERFVQLGEAMEHYESYVGKT